DDLCEMLAKEDVAWVQEFIRCNGLIWMFECFRFHVFILGTLRGEDEDEQKLELLVECLVEMINNGASGVKELIAIPNSFTNIVEALSFVSVPKKSQLFEVFAAMLLISSNSGDDSCWSLLTEAFHNYRQMRGADFRALLEELE